MRNYDIQKRIKYAEEQFKSNNIEYTIKSEVNGHIHAYGKYDNLLYQFWAGTGKILLNKESTTKDRNIRGIHNFIKILIKEV